MQTADVFDVVSDERKTSSPEANPFSQAIAEVEAQLSPLHAAFAQLDTLRAEEAECIQACDQVAAEEKAMLENPNGTEKQGVEKLLRIRATRDLRNAKLSNVRKRIAQHVDLLRYDICEPLRRNFTNLAFALLATRQKRLPTCQNRSQ